MSDIPKEEYDIAAILDMYVYLYQTNQDKDYNGLCLSDVLVEMGKNNSDINEIAGFFE